MVNCFIDYAQSKHAKVPVSRLHPNNSSTHTESQLTTRCKPGPGPGEPSALSHVICHVTVNLCAGFGGKTSACFGLFVLSSSSSSSRSTEAMGDLPNLSNGAIQVSLDVNSAVANPCV